MLTAGAAFQRAAEWRLEGFYKGRDDFLLYTPSADFTNKHKEKGAGREK